LNSEGIICHWYSCI